jgi:hypothetical protein
MQFGGTTDYSAHFPSTISVVTPRTIRAAG